MRKRRYEILLPLKHNDGSPVTDELFNQTKDDLLQRFDGLSTAPKSVGGVWRHEGQVYEDDLVKFVVDVDDSEENELFFSNLKSILMERFQQLEIYIVSFPINRV